MVNIELQNKIDYYKQKEEDRKKYLLNQEKELESLNLYLDNLRNIFSTKSNVVFQTALNNLAGEVIDDDEIIGTWKKDETNHRCIDVRCLKCNRERIVYSTSFFSKRPMKYQMCSCKSYSPKVIKEYKDTIRGTDIFIGLGAIEHGQQMVWIKCLICNKYRKVKGVDYLNSECVNTCEHSIEEKEKKITFNMLQRIGFYTDLDNLNYKKSGKKYKYADLSFYNKTFNNLIVKDCYILKKEYINNGRKSGIYWLCSCKLCGGDLIYRASDIVNGAITNCGCKNRIFFEQYSIGEVVSNNLIIRDIIKVKGDATYWNVQCPFCENTFVRKATDINIGHFKSCGCKKRSLGELWIKEILDKYKLNYKEQVSFKDLKEGSLRYDFMVEFVNKCFLIEYDGNQHYYESGQFTKTEAEKVFKSIQYNDNLKNEYAKFKGIPLLRIPYILDKEKLENMILDFIGGKNYV